jgi:hypothetical protein
VSPEELQSFFLVALGFAFAGSLAEGYQLVTAQPARFELLTERARADAILTVPFLVFAAPFIIMRNTLVACRLEGRGFLPATAATVLAAFWSLASGSVVVMALQAVGVLHA